MKIRACWLFQLLLLLLPCRGQAQTLLFLDMPSDAPAAGMGGVMLLPGQETLAGDAWPASTALSDVSRAVSVHGMAWNGTSDGDVLLGAGWFVRTGRWGLYGSVNDFLQQQLTEYNEVGAPLGTFRPRDQVWSAGASYCVNTRWAVSVTARYITTALASTADDAVPGFDAGVVYAVPHVRAGLSVRHVGPPVNYGGADCDQPMQLAGGAGVQFGDWSAAAEGVCVLEAGLLVRLGVQYACGRVMRFRAGCQLSDHAAMMPDYATAGLGCCLGAFRLDAACLFASPQLRPSLQLGAAWAVGRRNSR